MALITAYIAVVRGRPPGFASGKRSAINSHCSDVRLLGYALVIYSQGADVYKFQHKPCELSYNSSSLFKHPLSNSFVVVAAILLAIILNTNKLN